jgi:hypothetical protein
MLGWVSKSPLRVMLGALIVVCVLLVCVARQYLEANYARETVTELQLRLRSMEVQNKANSVANSDFYQTLVDDVRGINHFVDSLQVAAKRRQQQQQQQQQQQGQYQPPQQRRSRDDIFRPLSTIPPPLKGGEQALTNHIRRQRGAVVAKPAAAAAIDVSHSAVFQKPQGVRRILFPGVTVVIMFCFGRPQYLTKALSSLTTRLGEQVSVQRRRDGGGLSAPNSFLVVLSQDGNEPGISDIMDNAVKALASVSVVCGCSTSD